MSSFLIFIHMKSIKTEKELYAYENASRELVMDV